MKGTCPMLNKNESLTDRRIRVILGFAFITIGYFFLTGVTQTIVYGVGVIALITGVIGFCALYDLLGFSTLKRKTR